MERKFGPYTLVRQIAVGGMAEIHLARTDGIAGFEKYVAIKMIHPNYSEDPQFVQMLIDEAKITVQLAHSNIAQTFDLGRVGGTYYITMEYVEGCDLYKLLRTGSELDLDVPWDVAAYVVKEGAAGLDYAHRKRDALGQPLHIIHRDVSPQNLLVSKMGEVKLIDFGIAKASLRAQKTQAGVIKGKYYYMSPEQAWGQVLDARTDVFSAGIILYELLTGQMLYLEEELRILLDMVRKAEIAPPTSLRRDIPEELENIVMRALAKRPEDRYQTAYDFSFALDRFLHKHSPMFSAQKIRNWTEHVLGREEEEPAVKMPERDRRAVTQGFGKDELLNPEDDFNDENSIIFHVDELEMAHRAAQLVEQERDIDEQTGVVTPSASAVMPHNYDFQAQGRDIGDSTKAVMGDLAEPHFFDDNLPENGFGYEDDENEQTMISSPPGFEFPASDTPALPQMPPQQNRGGPTPIASPAQVHDYLPPIEPKPIPGHFQTEATLPQTTYQVDSNQVQDQGDLLSEVAEQQAVAPAWSQSTALNAVNPKPALSVLRPPRKSRSTPGRGIPMERQENSVLSKIITDTQPAKVNLSPVTHTGAAIHTPIDGTGRIQMRSATDSPPPSSSVSPVQTPYHLPQNEQYNLPQNEQYNLPQNEQPYGQNPGHPGSIPLQNLQQSQSIATPPYASIGGVQYSGMQAQVYSELDVDELPDAYKLTNRKSKLLWVLIALSFIVLALGAVAATYYLVTQKTDHIVQETQLTIVSSPEGAKVSIDGNLLEQKTPTTFTQALIDQSYVIEVDLKGHKLWTKDVLINQVDTKIIARLDLILVTLTVTSEPAGAEVYLNGSENASGRTPLTLSGIDPTIASSVEVRKEGYRPSKHVVDWSKDTKKTEVFLLKK